MPLRESERLRMAVWFAILALLAAVVIAGCGRGQTQTTAAGGGQQATGAGGQGAGPAGAGPGAGGGPTPGGGGGMRGGGMGMRGGGGGGGGMRGGGMGMRGGGGGGMRGGGGGGMRGGGTGMRGGGAMGGGTGAAAGGQATEAAPPPAKIEARKMDELDKAKKLQAFSAAYGPVTVAKEKSWDGRELEFVKFKFKGQQIKLPMDMVYDAKKPKDLEGYFGVYSAGRGW